jgi:hypothetical protein
MDLGDALLPEVWQIDYSKPGGKFIKHVQNKAQAVRSNPGWQLHLQMLNEDSI